MGKYKRTIHLMAGINLTILTSLVENHQYLTLFQHLTKNRVTFYESKWYYNQKF